MLDFIHSTTEAVSRLHATVLGKVVSCRSTFTVQWPMPRIFISAIIKVFLRRFDFLLSNINISELLL